MQKLTQKITFRIIYELKTIMIKKPHHLAEALSLLTNSFSNPPHHFLQPLLSKFILALRVEPPKRNRMTKKTKTFLRSNVVLGPV